MPISQKRFSHVERRAFAFRHQMEIGNFSFRMTGDGFMRKHIVGCWCSGASMIDAYWVRFNVVKTMRWPGCAQRKWMGSIRISKWTTKIPLSTATNAKQISVADHNLPNNSRVSTLSAQSLLDISEEGTAFTIFQLVIKYQWANDEIPWRWERAWNHPSVSLPISMQSAFINFQKCLHQSSIDIFISLNQSKFISWKTLKGIS